MPQESLKDFLVVFQSTSSTKSPLLGIGLDSCVIPLRHNSLNLVQTTDFFYPLIDDPYTMGRIACCNVLSDLYAMGVVDCDNMLMLLGISNKLSEKEKSVVVPLMLEGFRDCALEAGCSVQGGQTVINPWIIIGGVATSVCLKSEIIMPNMAEKGDLLVLTKPLGTRVAVNIHQWLMTNPTKFETVSDVITAEQAKKMFQTAAEQMARLNRNAAKLMHQFNARGCTDVTGFGLIGHAQNLVESQINPVSFEIYRIPVLAHSLKVDEHLKNFFKLREGKAAETSGGLLVILPANLASSYCEELAKLDEGSSAWIVGKVVDSSMENDRQAIISDQAEFIDIE